MESPSFTTYPFWVNLASSDKDMIPDKLEYFVPRWADDLQNGKKRFLSIADRLCLFQYDTGLD